MCHVTRSERCHDDVAKLTLYLSLQLKLTVALADLGFLEEGDFGNPNERSERALRDLARGGAQNDIEIT